jgi:hypothetical protein
LCQAHGYRLANAFSADDDAALTREVDHVIGPFGLETCDVTVQMSL